MEESKGSILVKLVLVLHCFSILCASQDFDFFYLVQQWPGSFCDSQKSCCFPTTGKPTSDFGIHGLWPNFKNGSFPSNCNPNNPFNETQISDLANSLQTNWPTLACPSGNGTKFWTHEWEKHGTCSESVLNQRDYFETTLKFKQKTNLLQALSSAGILPNGGFYNLTSITGAIKDAIGFTPHIQCNKDPSGNSQLLEVFLCVDTSGLNFIECPVSPRGRKCESNIEFPIF